MTARPDTGTGRDTRAHVAAGHHTNTTTRGDLMTSTTPTAGGILAAADALQGPQKTFTREQVAYLMHLAYDAGRTATYLDDVAELHANWARQRDPRPAAEQRIAQRAADMAEQGGDYRGGPVDWETGKPVRHLGAVA